MIAQRVIPRREILETGIDAAIAQRRRCRALVRFIEQTIFFGVTKRAILDFIFSFLKNDGVAHFEGLKNSFLEKFTVRFSRSFLYDHSQYHVSGIAVRPARPRSKPSDFLFSQQIQDFTVLNLSSRRPGCLILFFQRIHKVFIVGQTGSVIQEIANSDRFSVSGKIRKELRERLVVAQFSVADEEHDGHGRELLGKRSEPEIRVRVDFRFQTEVPYPVGFPKTVFSSLTDQDRKPRITGPDQPIEYRTDQSLGPPGLLTTRVPGSRQIHEQNRARQPKRSLLQCSPHFAEREHIIPLARNIQAAQPALKALKSSIAARHPGKLEWMCARRTDLVLTIRLSRIGKKKKPFYRVVVIERTRPRDGRVKEAVGTYDPLKKPAEIKLDRERIQYWMGLGAQPSDTVRSFLRLEKIA